MNLWFKNRISHVCVYVCSIYRRPVNKRERDVATAGRLKIRRIQMLLFMNWICPVLGRFCSWILQTETSNESPGASSLGHSRRRIPSDHLNSESTTSAVLWLMSELIRSHLICKIQLIMLWCRWQRFARTRFEFRGWSRIRPLLFPYWPDQWKST